MTWTENDLKNLRAKGYKIDDSKVVEFDHFKPEKKVEKVSVEKNTIELFLKQFQQQGLIESYQTEYKFDAVRRFRFDYAIPSLMIAIEYNGLIYKNSKNTTGKSGHQTIGGIKADNEKANLAVTKGWRILVYTAMNYKELYTDLEKLLKAKIKF